ncbi:MAG: HD domain-containing phosphohydrolase [Bacillota bacterium]
MMDSIQPGMHNDFNEHQHFFQSVINFLPDPVFAIDTEGKVILWNEAIENLTGKTAAEMLGKANYEHSYWLNGERKPSLIDLAIDHSLPPEEATGANEFPIQRDENNCIYGETMCVNSEGDNIYFQVKASPLYNSKGSLLGAISYLKDFTKAKDIETKIHQLSFHDFLTGLYNRAFIDEELKNLDSEEELPLSVIRAEINGLKLVNDTFGYQQGDNLIVKGASIIKDACIDDATICRWNGSGFTIVLPKTDYQTSLALCHKIESSCKQCTGTAVPLSISFGTATKVDVAEDINRIIGDAEKMMLRSKVVVSRDMRGTIISSLQKLLEEKTEETVEHAVRINNYATEMGRIIGLTSTELHELTLLAALHDLGKIAIPDSIILKADKLTPEEWEIMKKHSEIGYTITQSIPELSHISQKILHHHEWWNGQGYPDGLAGEEIPLLSRIIAVVDAYDVMISGRSYKKSFSPSKALAELKKFSGTHFEPHLVNIFIDIMQNKSTGLK